MPNTDPLLRMENECRHLFLKEIECIEKNPFLKHFGACIEIHKDLELCVRRGTTTKEDYGNGPKKLQEQKS